jgi:hypothetical protein
MTTDYLHPIGGKQDSVREAKAPPGEKYEKLVLDLKKQYPDDPEKAFATAWSIYNKEHGKTASIVLKRIAQQIEEATSTMPDEEVDVLKKAFDDYAKDIQDAKNKRDWKTYKEKLKQLKDKIAKFLVDKAENSKIAQQVKIEQPLPEASVNNEPTAKGLIGSLKTLNDMIIRDVNILKKIENNEELSETEKQIIFSEDPKSIDFEALEKKIDGIAKTLNNVFLD